MMEIFVSLLLTFIVIGGLMAFAGERSGRSVLPIFVLFFLAIWTGGLWLTPVGPPLIGVYWMPFLFVAIFIALFWAAAPPPPRRRRTGEQPTPGQEGDMVATAASLGLLFWVLLVGLAIAALVHYAPMVAPVAQAL